MSARELVRMEMALKKGATPAQVARTLQAARAALGGEGPSLPAVYRFARGFTYKRGAKERRGSGPLKGGIG